MNTSSEWYLYTKRADFAAIARAFQIDPVTARVLRNRGISSEEELSYFFRGSLADLYDEMLLPDMEKAALLLEAAVREGVPIRIIGDYDIDGVCATYILEEGLKGVGARVDHRIPERIRDGYGLNRRLVEEAAQDGIRLLITCDNGIAALEELALAKAKGLQVIVTDHHEVRKDENGLDILPAAEAVVDVKRTDSRYPFTEICGAVTAWKLIRALYRNMGRAAADWLRFLDFAAIATIGDIMPLIGENRIIVREGLKRLKSSDCLGLRQLVHTLGLFDKAIDTYHVGFIIGPCINAAGRLETAESAMRLFQAADSSEAEKYSMHLMQLNESRKLMTEHGVREGIAMAETEGGKDPVLVVYLQDLHESLAGIVAGRLRESCHRPVFVITKSQEGLKGSGRSIEAYNMFEGLCKAEDLLTKFGGHRMAAGLSLPVENLEALKQRLNETAGLTEADFRERIWIDAAMPVSYVTERLIRELEALAPYGNGFERPVFAERGLRVHGLKVLGKNRNALRLELMTGDHRAATAIRFCEADKEAAALQKASEIDILYYPKINEYNGRRSIQLELLDWRIRKTAE